MEGRILECEIGYARVGAEDTVLEVGAGIGNLTERLATRAGQVIAIECDQQFDAHKVRLTAVSDVAKRTAQKPRKRPGNP